MKVAVEGSVRMFLQLLDHLANASQLLSSPQAATLLLTPIPGSKTPPKQTNADELIKGIQVQLAVILWMKLVIKSHHYIYSCMSGHLRTKSSLLCPAVLPKAMWQVTECTAWCAVDFQDITSLKLLLVKRP